MSKAATKLMNACGKFSEAYANACNMAYDCEEAGYGLDQEDYNFAVEDHEGDEVATKKELIRGYKGDLKAAIRGLKELSKAAAALADALPAVAEERIEDLMALEYTGDLGEDDDSY
jgi:hypothetical protein